jgi:hypothetical protein
LAEGSSIENLMVLGKSEKEGKIKDLTETKKIKTEDLMIPRFSTSHSPKQVHFFMLIDGAARQRNLVMYSYTVNFTSQFCFNFIKTAGLFIYILFSSFLRDYHYVPQAESQTQDPPASASSVL